MNSDDLFELRSAKPSLVLRFLTWVISKRPSVFPTTEDGAREFLANRKPPKDEPIPEKLERKHRAEHWEAEGQQCVTLHPSSGGGADGKGAQHIIYFHGGGFVLPMFELHWPFVAALADLTNASVTVPLYDVVPESPYTNAEALADAAFAKIAQDWDPAQIIAAGDSAGGHMAVNLVLRAKAAGRAQPGKLLLLSPWLDLSLADDAARVVEAKDIMLNVDPLRVMGEVWAGTRDPKAPECSPLYADLTGLSPTRIFQGRHDLFVVDCRNFMSRAREVEAPVKLYEYAGAAHVFMILPGTRERADTMALIKDFVAE